MLVLGRGGKFPIIVSPRKKGETFLWQKQQMGWSWICLWELLDGRQFGIDTIE
jgi:hypothetical protein